METFYFIAGAFWGICVLTVIRMSKQYLNEKVNESKWPEDRVNHT